MNNAEYVRSKAEVAYNLLVNGKFSKKSRTIVIEDGKLFVIKVEYSDGRIHYLLPGGTVDDGETTKQAATRETLEEYNLNVVPVKLLGRLYYKMKMEYMGKVFQSRVIDFFYICKIVSDANLEDFGISGEFEKADRKYSKVKLSLDELKKINHNDLNDMDKVNFDKLIKYLEESL